MEMRKSARCQWIFRRSRLSLSIAALISLSLVAVSGSQQLAPVQESIGMVEAKARAPEPVAVDGWPDKHLVPFLMFEEPAGSAAEIGARNIYGDQMMSVWVQDLDGDNVGEILVFHGDRCDKLEFQGQKRNCAYSVLAWDGKAWEVALSHMARQVHLALGYQGEVGFAFDGLTFGYKNGRPFPVGGGEWQPAMETEVEDFLKAMSVKAADDIEFIDLPFKPANEDLEADGPPRKDKPAAEPNWTKKPDIMVRMFEPFGSGASGSVADISTDGIEEVSGNRLRLARGAVTGGYRWAVIFNERRLAFGFSDVSPVAVVNLNGDLVIATRDRSGLQEYRIGSANKNAR